MPTFTSARPFRSAATATRRLKVGQRLAIVAVAYAFVVTMVATTLPSPLYELYRHQFGFSELMITVIFATYGVGVLAASYRTHRYKHSPAPAPPRPDAPTAPAAAPAPPPPTAPRARDRATTVAPSRCPAAAGRSSLAT